MIRCRCGQPIFAGRANLGYTSCAPCGEQEAKEETANKSRRVLPGYHKGGYQYTTNPDQPKEINKNMAASPEVGLDVENKAPKQKYKLSRTIKGIRRVNGEIILDIESVRVLV
jgi:uncharacterized Zn finger protein (UPF0148 family)